MVEYFAQLYVIYKPKYLFIQSLETAKTIVDRFDFFLSMCKAIENYQNTKVSPLGRVKIILV